SPRLRPCRCDSRDRRDAGGGARGGRPCGGADPLRHGPGGGRRVKRALATLVVAALCTAYIVWKIDLGRTGRVLVHAQAGWWLLSLGIMAGSVWPMAWRWQRLLAARDVHERLPWLVRAYFVGYAAGQVLPTSLGGDASRIYETVRRHEGAGGAAAGTVLLERMLGGVATLVLAALGFALAVGHYDVMGPLLFLVMLVPFTVNGLAVRESFFVSFLGALGIGADRAFATGFLFFVVTIALALPGVAILLRHGIRRG